MRNIVSAWTDLRQSAMLRDQTVYLVSIIDRIKMIYVSHRRGKFRYIEGIEFRKRNARDGEFEICKSLSFSKINVQK